MYAKTHMWAVVYRYRQTSEIKHVIIGTNDDDPNCAEDVISNYYKGTIQELQPLGFYTYSEA